MKDLIIAYIGLPACVTGNCLTAASSPPRRPPPPGYEYQNVNTKQLLML